MAGGNDGREAPERTGGQRVTILVDGEGSMPFLEHSRVREAQVTHLAALSN